MTNSFPLLTILTVVVPVWTNFSGDIHREGGTNLIHQGLWGWRTNVCVEEVVLCTNRTVYKRVDAPTTNSVTRWTPLLGPGLPPLPGQFLKE